MTKPRPRRPAKQQAPSEEPHRYCESPACPAAPACGAARAEAFLLLGPFGTRPLGPPWVPTGAVERPDVTLGERIAARAARLSLSQISLIAAQRDDLPDGGSEMLAAAVRAIRRASPATRIEITCGDFGREARCLRSVLAARPQQFHVGLGTCPRLYPKVLPGCDYVAMLECLRVAREEFETVRLKATLSFGLGETRDELVACIADLKSVRVEELCLAPAPPELRRGSGPSADWVERVALVARKLAFDRVAVLAEPRPCGVICE